MKALRKNVMAAEATPVMIRFTGYGTAANEAPPATAIVRFVRNATLFLAAPFIGLAYALAFPFVGIGVLAWNGACAAFKR